MPATHNLDFPPSGVTLDGTEPLWVDKFVDGVWYTYQFQLSDVAQSGFGAQVANKVLAGPISGIATTPSFRELVWNDLPLISELSGTSGINAGDLLVIEQGGVLLQVTAAQLQAALGGGTVTSVGLTMPGVLFAAVAGSPVTSSGTLAVTLATQTANKVLAGPISGIAATPTFRSLVWGDLPLPDALSGTSAIGGPELLAIEQGGVMVQVTVSQLQAALGGGTVSSITASGGLQTTTGSPITTTGTVQGAFVINAQTGTGYAVLAADRGKHVTQSNAAAAAYTIAQAGTTGFENGYFTIIENIGVGALTLTPTTSTVNGAATLVLTSGMSAILMSDGTNYRALVFEAAGILVNAQTGTSYTYLNGDRKKLVTHTNAAAIAGTLPQATGAFGVGWSMWVENRGAGTLTITPTTSTIDGAASLALTTNQGCLIVSDGTNYFTMRGVGSAGGGGSSTITFNRQTASYTLVLGDCNGSTQVEMNVAGANNLTVPLNATVAAAIGTVVYLSQYGAGQTTVVATGGVTLRTPSTLLLRAQYSSAFLLKVGTDEWYLGGDLQ